jgi:hypothetical protein
VISFDGTGLRARYGTAFVGALEHWNYDTFKATWEAAWRGSALLTFVLDAAGQPSRLEGMGARFSRKSETPGPSAAAQP